MFYVMMAYAEVTPNVLCYIGLCRGYVQCVMMAYAEVMPNVLCYVGICRGYAQCVISFRPKKLQLSSCLLFLFPLQFSSSSGGTD